MDDHHKDLLRELFVVATERLEAAHEMATAGQSGAPSDQEIADAVYELQMAADDIAKLAGAMTVLLGRAADGHP